MKYPQIRMRRRRLNQNIRDLSSETNLSVADFIMPLFVVEGENIKEEINKMQNIYRYSIDKLIDKIKYLSDIGIKYIMLFPYIEDNIKDKIASNSYKENNLVARAINSIKHINRDIVIIADIALDPYNISGHDGIVENNKILNDETIEILKKQSLNMASAGADIIAPSDMMDGRIGAIREMLDNNNYQDILIMSYSCKYASNLYQGFRYAVGSEKSFNSNEDKINNKYSYQMDIRNKNEAIYEASLDINEGADFLIVKPANFYLDIINEIEHKFKFPIIAYQVSSEYMMLKLLSNYYDSNFNDLLMESLIACKRAGASKIISYASDIAINIISKN